MRDFTKNLEHLVLALETLVYFLGKLPENETEETDVEVVESEESWTLM